MKNAFDPHIVFLQTTYEASEFSDVDQNMLGKMVHDEEISKEERIHAKSQLALANMRKALSVSKSHSNSSADKEDLTQELYITLFNETDRYDPHHEAGASFSTYAHWKLHTFASNYRRKSRREGARWHQSEDEYFFREYSEKTMDDCAAIEDIQLTQRGMEILQKINPQWHDIIQQYFGLEKEPKNTTEIGKLLGVSKNMIQAKLQSALRCFSAILELEQCKKDEFFHECLHELNEEQERKGRIISQLFMESEFHFTINAFAKKEGTTYDGAVKIVVDALKKMIEKLDIYNALAKKEKYNLRSSHAK